jgi:DNA-binding helix-hairpin-helix protein with protein kinase domain
MQADAFSLSVILFQLWTNNHPLEGKASCVPIMDGKTEKKIYGENPVFIFDPNDESNRPVPSIHKAAVSRWPVMPEYLKETFIKAFSKEALKNPQSRIIEPQWLKIFNRMKDEKFDIEGGTPAPDSDRDGLSSASAKDGGDEW